MAEGSSSNIQQMKIEQLTENTVFSLWKMQAVTDLNSLRIYPFVRSEDPIPIPEPGVDGRAAFVEADMKGQQYLQRAAHKDLKHILLGTRDTREMWEMILAEF